MWKKLIAALLAALTSFFPIPSGNLPASPGGTVRCLAVGMDLFVTEENTAPCSANNTEVMAALFSACLPEGTEVTRSVNGPGSAAELARLILDTFGDAGEGDVSYFYLSTHGVAWETEDGGARAALILSDGIREEAVQAETLRTMMDLVPGKKVLILDCCHAGLIARAFGSPAWRVLAGCGPEEDCYFQSAGEETGTGYFTSALESALLASDREQIDPDGDGRVTLDELAARTREIYGVSTAGFLPEGDGSPLFLLPEDAGAPERLLGIAFDGAAEADGRIELSFRFRTETAVKVEYRLAYAGENGWDFENAARLPDRERTGSTRGLMAPGEKTRTIRVTRDKLGPEGKALLQVISWRGIHRQVPVIEASVVVDGGR